MNNYQLEEIKPYLEDYLQRNGVDTSKKMFRCLICGSSDACHIVPNSNGQIWKCFSAKHSSYGKDTGDIFTYVEQLRNINFTGAYSLLADEYHLTSTPQEVKKFTVPQKKPEQITEEQAYTEFELQEVQKILNAIKDNPSEYLYRRGISYETQKRYNIGYLQNFVHPKILWKNRNNPQFRAFSTPRVIVPTSTKTIIARATRSQDEGKNGNYKVLKVGDTHIFNGDTLRKNIGYCFCFEGEIDALSGIECGFNSIGLGSTSMIEKLFKEYQINPENVLIIAMDNDEGGKNSVSKFVDMAKSNEIPYIVADTNLLFNGAKDCNQALQNGREVLTKQLEQYKVKAINLDKSQFKRIEPTQTPQDKPKVYEFNYIGEIDRAFDLCKSHLRYCHQTKTWYQYDGTRLNQDTTEIFIDSLHKQIDQQCKKELEYYNSKDNAELLKSAKKEHKYSISDKGLLGAIKGIKRREPIAITLLELDKSNLLNCEDITLNLDTLKIHEHTITDLCTKLAPVKLKTQLNPEYVEHWNNFINQIMCEDTSMAEFLQRVCGYCLYPTNKEECFFILYGSTTRNGKSTLLESIKNVLGDYSKAVSSATLSEKPTGKEANPEIISLIGSKLVTCGELNSETLLNDTLLKSWIGNDTISARNLFDNNVLNFHLDGKLLCNCNELPPMKNDDLLNSNRIVVIPFDRHFKEHEQNKDLKRLFATPEYKTVILAWLIEGYRNYLRLGIKANMPIKVVQAIENYQSEANTINVFLNDEDIFERIDIKNYADAIKINNKNLYSIYVDWCRENNCKPLSSTNFKKQLKKNRNYIEDSYYKGIRYKKVLSSYRLKPKFVINSIGTSDRLVAITQRELEQLKK